MSVTFEREREVDLSPWGYETKAKVRRMNGRQSAELKRAAAKSNNLKIKGQGKNPVPEMTPAYEDDILYVLYTLAEAPFPITKDGIMDQDQELIEYLSREAQDINSYFFLKAEATAVRCPQCGAEFDPEGSETPAFEDASPGPTLNALVRSNGTSGSC